MLWHGTWIVFGKNTKGVLAQGVVTIKGVWEVVHRKGARSSFPWGTSQTALTLLLTISTTSFRCSEARDGLSVLVQTCIVLIKLLPALFVFRKSTGS